MMTKDESINYKAIVDRVINYMLANLTGDLSLETLADLANYSPFHFQKLFKSVTKESPKQYIIRIRLETAAQYVIIHPHKSITEIAIDCGFSSASVFARSFKNYFGMSAEEMKQLPPKLRGRIRLQSTSADINFIPPTQPPNPSADTSSITVKRLSASHVVYLNAPFFSNNSIQKTFKTLAGIADAHDLRTPASQFAGILYPHQNLYRAGLTNAALLPDAKIAQVQTVAAGKYATFSYKGSLEDTFSSLRYFYEVWLPDSGYMIGDIFGFELLAENPSIKPYEDIERELYIPIKPK